MKNKINILVYGMSSKIGGIEEFLLNVYKNINKEKFKFGFIITDGKKPYCYDEIIKLGGEVFLPKYRNNLQKNYEIKRIMKYCRKNYDIIYFNTSAIYNIAPYIYAKKLNFNKFIVHAHNTKDESVPNIKQMFHYFNRKIVSNFSDIYLACSNEAGIWLFGKNFKHKKKSYIIHNAINLDKFSFNKEIRNFERKEMNINENEIVIGHIGRFELQKNHDYLIDVFKIIHSKNEKMKLLLIGDGTQKIKIKNKVRNLGLENDVIFIDARKDVNKLYNVMDIFVLPSLYEGLGIVLIEAQTNGLHCIASTNVPKIANAGNLVEFVDLNNKEEFANAILNANITRENRKKEIIKNGYSITYEIKKIEKIFEDKLK